MKIYAAALAVFASQASAQWDPANGDWLKSHAEDLRVMTWNVEDGICRTNVKTDAQNNWNALVRVVASMQPDVLMLQETGDNSGNGTGSGVDSLAAMVTVIDYFLHGGLDQFNGNTTITSYVQKFAPAYDLPYLHISTVTDSFNRNLILSRYPFADLNGDNDPSNDTFTLQSDAWQGGGTAGIRGFSHVEIDLPDATYGGDVVVGNSHLKAGGSGSDLADRIEAAQNISYYLRYYYDGNGTGVADPNNKVSFPTLASTVLDADTPIIWGGDWNNNPAAKGPVEWMIEGGVAGGSSDGIDKDGTDATRDTASHPISGETSTQSGSKLDYIAWQDSVATARRMFIFRTTGSGVSSANMPAPVLSFPRRFGGVSSTASDHRPVIVDFILPAPPPPCPADLNGDGILDNADIAAFLSLFLGGDLAVDFNGDGILDNSDISAFIVQFLAGC